MAVGTVVGTAVGTLSREDRAALARAALARAEQRTGARSVLPPGGPAVTAEPGPSGRGTVGRTPAHREPDAAAAPALVALTHVPEAPAEQPATGIITSERPPMAVPPPLAPILPEGLRRGGTTVVTGSTSLVLAMLAHACAGGAWASVVGQPTIGLLAAAQAGVSLDRLAVVPRPGPEAPTVVAALLDGVDVVVVGPEAALTETERRKLSARARDRGSVLMSTVDWPGAGVVLTVEAGRWTGVDAGEGRLRTHELRLVRTGRGSAAVPRSLDLTLPIGSAPAPAPEPQAQTPTTGLRLVG
ncbi:hypothetical protein [Cellulomonas xylanilytica]|uniref:Protein RecA n=1 Tax=Cellulomonas xylanilytica TaxID=233583 RepID=A0A510V301_9CELL|nr:hypothetical protein [Cellulomonas xylanilytica]GEK21186.1 hypothetical protein CXY01_17060 [Cellulomonas xylanilytica]